MALLIEMVGTVLLLGEWVILVMFAVLMVLIVSMIGHVIAFLLTMLKIVIVNPAMIN